MHYDGFTIYHCPFFRLVVSEKNSIFGLFTEHRLYILTPVSTISFEMLIFLNLLMKYHWVVVGAVFSSASFYKKLNFRYRFDIPPCPLRFSNLTLIFYQSIGRIRLHTAKLHWHGHNWLRPKFPLCETFLQTSFWRKQLKSQFFQRASVTLSQFSGLISREWHSKTLFYCDLRLLIEKLLEPFKKNL